MHYRKHFFLVLAALLFLSDVGANAPTDSSGAKRRRFELAMNITNAISRFSGNGVKNVSEDPYLIALKWQNRNGKRAWRLGFNQFYTSQRTNLFPGTRTSTDLYFSPLIGHEWRIHLDKRFMFFYGLDARVSYRQEEIISSDFQGIQKVYAEEKAAGFGPLCGFAWKVNNRVMLYTEANYYVNYLTVKRDYDDGVSTIQLENSAKYTLTPVIPTSLFLTVNF